MYVMCSRTRENNKNKVSENSNIYWTPCRYLLLQHGVVGVPGVAGGDEIVGDDGDLLREQSADVETELDHGGGSAAAAAVAVVWER